MPESSRETPPPPPVHDLSTYLSQIKDLPEVTNKNARTVLSQLSTIVSDVNYAFVEGELHYSSEELDEFISLIEERIGKIPETGMRDIFASIDSTRDYLKEIKKRRHALGRKTGKENFFGENSIRVAEQTLTEITTMLEERVHNPGHQAHIDRGASEKVWGFDQIVAHLTTIRPLVEHGFLQVSPAQIDRFEKALLDWLSTVEASDERLQRNQLDPEAVNALLSDMRKKGKRE